MEKEEQTKKPKDEGRKRKGRATKGGVVIYRGTRRGGREGGVIK